MIRVWWKSNPPAGSHSEGRLRSEERKASQRKSQEIPAFNQWVGRWGGSLQPDGGKTKTLYPAGLAGRVSGTNPKPYPPVVFG